MKTKSAQKFEDLRTVTVAHLKEKGAFAQFDEKVEKASFEAVFNDGQRRQTFGLVKVKSNLGKGTFWMIECPETGRRCRKLFLFEGCFRSRAALIKEGLLTDCQKKPKRFRTGFWRLFEMNHRFERIKKKAFSPNTKSTYRDRPTKFFSKALKLAEEYDSLARSPEAFKF